MTQPDPRPGDHHGAPDPALVEDWITIWQSELTAIVLDAEARDTALRAIEAWAAQCRAANALLAPDDPAGLPPGPDAPPRPPPLAAASAEPGPSLDGLLARIAGLGRPPGA